MSRQEGSETPVFSMRVKPAPADHESVLVSDLARAVTGMLEASRGGITGVLGAGARVFGVLRERGEDWVEGLHLGGVVEECYALLGIASAGALSAMDERIDEVEMRMDDVARQRTREELMLLHQRLAELEAVVRTRHEERDETGELDTLLDRLGELEARIDRIPWPAAQR
jgi:hypothetical protein